MIEDQKLLELSDFSDLIGETFIFSLEGVDEKAEGVLTSAKLSKSGTAPGIEREPFELDFKFPAGANIGQCTFNVVTASGKEFSPLFLVPVAEDEDGWYMVSTIN